MSLAWRREEAPVWDGDKERIAGGLPDGVLPGPMTDGTALPGEWFMASDGDAVVGYGWLDVTWGGDAEVLFVVDPDRQNQGIGSFVMASLEREAAARGINYVYNTVPEAHPDRQGLHDWLLVRGYEGNETDASLRKHVRADEGDEPAPWTQGAAPTEMPADAMPPGHEESGGYVTTERHRF